MIRIVLLGRTGNNLFQYALGRVVASKHGVPLILDGSWFNREGWREVSCLLRLPIQAKVVRNFSLASRALRKITGKHHWEYRGVPVLHDSSDDQSFDERFLNAPADCVLFGYFQSPLYFQSISDSLRAELRELLSGAVDLEQSLKEALSSPESVAVHVRRTDFLNNPIFQVCGREYYANAIDRMREKLSSPEFFIFSDDPDWCRKKFVDSDQHVVESAKHGGNPLHDLCAMSLASNHIIANSSYSWWAAWIGYDEGNNVMLPSKWYKEGIFAPIEEKRLAAWEVVEVD